MSHRRNNSFTKRIDNGDFDDDDNDEFEWHAILRLPPSKADIVDEIMSNEKFNVTQMDDDGDADDEMDDDIEFESRKPPIGINFDRGELRINDEILGFRIYNLPCILETYKTFDKVDVFKIGDISQILICNEDATISSPMNNSELGSPNYGDPLIGKRRNKISRLPHGLTPPMKNVTKVRFRRSKKSKFVDAPLIDQQLRGIFRRDMDAHKIEFELLDEEDNRIDSPEEPILPSLVNETSDELLNESPPSSQPINDGIQVDEDPPEEIIPMET